MEHVIIKNKVKPIPYHLNKRLTEKEFQALKYYKDINTKQHIWNREIPKRIKTKDSYAINNYYRDMKTYDDDREEKKLKNNIDIFTGFEGYTATDERLVDTLSNYISRAINKSPINNAFTVFRGLSRPQGVQKAFEENKTFVESGFSSFSTNYAIADSIAKEKSKDGNHYLLRYDFVPNQDYAIYIDSVQDEWLLPKNMECLVTEREEEAMINGKKRIIYYIMKANI